MEIRNFLTLKEVVETGSFTAASKKLHYAQSSVTAHIQSIEDHLGVKLFDRVGKKIILTEIGNEVYEHALSLLEIYRRIEGLPKKSKEIAGELKIGIPESLMVYKLSNVLKEFKEKFPLVTLTIETETCEKLREKISKGDLDVAFNIDIKMENPNIIFEKIKEEEMRIICAPEIKDIDKKSKLTVLYTEKGCSYRNIFEKYLESNYTKKRNQIETPSVELIKKYVMCGMGISLLPLYAIQSEIEEGSLNAFEIKSEDALLIQMLYNKNRWIFPAMEKFLELVRSKENF